MLEVRLTLVFFMAEVVVTMNLLDLFMGAVVAVRQEEFLGKVYLGVMVALALLELLLVVVVAVQILPILMALTVVLVDVLSHVGN